MEMARIFITGSSDGLAKIIIAMCRYYFGILQLHVPIL
jgi:hypothetical protein